MLITTSSQSSRARSTRRRWPSWSAPIVGTKPTRRPVARAARDQARTSVGVVSSIMVRLEAVVFVGIAPRAYVLAERRHGLLDFARERRVLLHKLRMEPIIQPQHVVQHEDLSVARGPCPDPDRRNRQRFRDLGRER